MKQRERHGRAARYEGRAMEEIFYAALALHIAGKPINKENVQTVLEHAGTPVDGTALGALAAFVKSLEDARRKKEKAIDSRIVKFLTAQLAQHKVRTNRLEALLEAATAEETLEDDETGAQPEGRYVYGVAMDGRKVMLGPIGLDGREVYTIPNRDIVAVVHDCSGRPYQSNDDEVVKGWVRSHQRVLDVARQRFGPVVPTGFDTILQPKDNTANPEQGVKDWLEEDGERLRTMLKKIEGKDEYVVQVSYEPSVIVKRISEESEEVRRIRDEMTTKTPGTAYLYRQKLEKALRAETDRLAESWFRDFLGRISSYTDDTVIERTKKPADGKVMFLNLSCLVARDKVAGLGEELEKIDHQEGFSVHFSGPWPPYSFVAKPVVSTQGE